MLNLDFYDTEEIPSNKTLVYDPRIEAWALTTDLNIIQTKVAAPSDLIAFIQGNYGLIFETYNPSTDFVIEHLVTNDVLYSLVSPAGEANLKPALQGFFKIEREQGYGWVLKQFTPALDTWIDLGDQANVLLTDIEAFFDSEATYIAAGWRHRKGALIYGPPGNGKSRTILQAVSTLKTQVAVIFVNDTISPSYLGEFQTALNGTPIIFVFEELTGYTDEGKLSALLTFLDGQDSWVNCYTIATTNYAADIPANVIDRPSRFELLLPFDNPTADIRIKYLTHYGFAPDETLLKATKGFSLDHLRYVVLRHKLTNVSLLDIVETIKTNRKAVSSAFKGRLGF